MERVEEGRKDTKKRKNKMRVRSEERQMWREEDIKNGEGREVREENQQQRQEEHRGLLL